MAYFLPVSVGAEPFSSYWSSLSEDEKLIVDRVAEDLASGNTATHGAAHSFESLTPALKAHFRERAIDELGVDPALSGAGANNEI